MLFLTLPTNRSADGPRPQHVPSATAIREINCFPGVLRRCDRGPVALRSMGAQRLELADADHSNLIRKLR
ncbi:MAG: hypothetical protein L0Z50_03495, partial [Verrucomicrobiales bacterium]|nr:hypothetical protein [Verrucomicrobiales bacterium]